MPYDPIQANEPLLREIAEFCERTGISPTGLGEGALNDKSFVRGLREGRQVLPRTMHRLRSFMAEQLADGNDRKTGAA